MTCIFTIDVLCITTSHNNHNHRKHNTVEKRRNRREEKKVEHEKEEKVTIDNNAQKEDIEYDATIAIEYEGMQHTTVICLTSHTGANGCLTAPGARGILPLETLIILLSSCKFIIVLSLSSYKPFTIKMDRLWSNALGRFDKILRLV